MKIKSRYVDTSSGYVKLYIPGVGVIEEHRHIMQEYLGRKLCYNEVVHHKDGDGQNNALENLEVMDRSAHARLHATTGIPMTILVCTAWENLLRGHLVMLNPDVSLVRRIFIVTIVALGELLAAVVRKIQGSVDQWAEYWTSNPDVAGSSSICPAVVYIKGDVK